MKRDFEFSLPPLRLPGRQWGWAVWRSAQCGGQVAWCQPAVRLPLKPCRWSPVLIPRVLPHRSTSFGLMMIDYGGFFITLNLISAWSNLSNDCSLLAIVKFKSVFILLRPQPVGKCWDASRLTHIFWERVGINDSQSSVMDRKSWRFCRSYMTHFLGRTQGQFPLD